ncbi:MAG: VOC family protein [Candidatus Firestonebacteria bacterium]
MLEHFGITVKSIENSTVWYRENFGFEEVKRFDKPGLELKGAVIKLDDISLELLQPYKISEKENNHIEKGILLEDLLAQAGLAHIAISVKDLESAYKEIKGSNPVYLTEIFESKYFFCADPDGILLEIKQAKT